MPISDFNRVLAQHTDRLHAQMDAAAVHAIDRDFAGLRWMYRSDERVRSVLDKV